MSFSSLKLDESVNGLSKNLSYTFRNIQMLNVKLAKFIMNPINNFNFIRTSKYVT